MGSNQPFCYMLSQISLRNTPQIPLDSVHTYCSSRWIGTNEASSLDVTRSVIGFVACDCHDGGHEIYQFDPVAYQWDLEDEKLFFALVDSYSSSE